MKRKLSVLLAVLLCVVLCLPATAYAKNYDATGTDMTISVDDTRWFVFTRDNLENNEELLLLGYTEDSMMEFLEKNNIYVYGILIYENNEVLELFVRKAPKKTDVVNLSNYDDEDAMDFASELAKKQGVEDYTIYKNEYKFANLEYVDQNYGCYLNEFTTIVNKEIYTVTFQATSAFVDGEYKEMNQIVDSIQFDVDESLKEKKKPSGSNDVITMTIVGAVAGGAAGGVMSFLRKKKKGNKDTEET